MTRHHTITVLSASAVTLDVGKMLPSAYGATPFTQRRRGGGDVANTGTVLSCSAPSFPSESGVLSSSVPSLASSAVAMGDAVSDVVVVADGCTLSRFAETKLYAAHRIILALRSPLLLEMLFPNEEEGEEEDQIQDSTFEMEVDELDHCTDNEKKSEKALHHKFAVNSSESHHPPFLSFDRSRGELLLRCSPPVVDCVLAFMYQDRFQLPNGETERVPELIRCVDALQMDDLMYLLLKKYGTKFVQHSLHSENKVQQCYAPVAAPQTLSAHVRKLYCEPSIMAERTADVWLAVAIKGGPQLKKIPCHRVLLTARSFFFQLMFTGAWKEAAYGHYGQQARVVRLDDSLTEIGLEVLVSDIYLGSLPPRAAASITMNASNDNAAAVMEAILEFRHVSEYFMLPSITEHIEVVLRPQLSYSNVSDIWNFSHEHGVHSLSRMCRKYVVENFVPVSLTPSFLSVKPALLRLALEEGNIDADEDAMVSSIIRYVRSNSPKGSTDADIFKLLEKFLPPHVLFNVRTRLAVMQELRQPIWM